MPSSNELNLIQDPETGLALLAKCAGEETPAQTRNREFWQYQFLCWRAWRAGDVEAIAYAVTCCMSYYRPPPLWLCRAGYELHEQCRAGDEKRQLGALREHIARWKAVELVRGRRPGDPRNHKRRLRGDAVWAEAAKLVAGTAAEASAETVCKSHALIRRAGGAQVTLASYRREVGREMERRKRRRKK